MNWKRDHRKGCSEISEVPAVVWGQAALVIQSREVDCTSSGTLLPLGLCLLGDALPSVGLLRLNRGTGAFRKSVASAGVAAVEDKPGQRNGKGYRQ